MHVGMGVTTMEGMWSQLRGWHLGVGGAVLGEGLRVQIQTQRNTWGRGGGQEVGVLETLWWAAMKGGGQCRLQPLLQCGDVGCGDVGT